MNGNTSRSSGRERVNSLFTENEIIVSQILLGLKNLMSLSESLAGFSWKCKKRRYFLDAAPPLHGAPSRQSQDQRFENEIEERVANVRDDEAVQIAEKYGKVAITTTSPDTPFDFLPGDESDEKFKHSSNKTSKKRSREEYLNMMEEMTLRKELLRGEIENVKKHYQNLRVYNSQLKAKKQEVLKSRKEESAPMAQEELQYLPLSHRSDDVLGSVNHVGPFMFDLNIPAEEACDQPLDVSIAIADKQARFAEARRNRREIMKMKSSRKGVENITYSLN